MSQLNKKLIKITIMVVIGLVVAIAIFMFLNRDKTLSFIQIEDRLKAAAINYYKDNEDKLPKTNGNRVIVSGAELENGYMKPMSTMIEEGIVCNGEVRVLKNDEQFLYIPYLNCGNAYVTKELYKVITDTSNIVKQGNGLYNMNKEYVYRGEKVNNYIMFSNKLWRIIKVDDSNMIKIIEETTKNKYHWDNRYNNDKKSTVGINNYEDIATEDSRIKKYLEQLYNDPKFIDEGSKVMIANNDICVGARSDTSENKTGTAECSKVSKNQPLGLVNVSDYMAVSLDANCKNVNSRACANYNYMYDFIGSWWTLTPVAGTTHRVYSITGTVVESNASSERTVRVALYLNENVIYNGGDGSKENPYIIKEILK